MNVTVHVDAENLKLEKFLNLKWGQFYTSLYGFLSTESTYGVS